MKLFKAEAAPRLIDDNGNLKPVAVLDGQELDMSLSKWIAKETNANLLKQTHRRRLKRRTERRFG